MGRVGGCVSVGVYIGIVYIVPKIGGLYVSCSLHQYCMYNANNWGDKYKLLGVFRPFGPRTAELYFSWCLHCTMQKSLKRAKYFVSPQLRKLVQHI